jgi:hypothetical protein
MSEAEWLALEDPTPMLEYLRDKASERKLRLIAVAVCRLMSGGRVVDAAEKHADGMVSKREMREAADEELWHMNNWYRHMGAEEVESAQALYRAVTAPRADEAAALVVEEAGTDRAGIACSLLREVCGNPFRRVALDPAWLTWRDSTISKLAQVIYDDRAFDRLPILADALEDAGCTDADILSHCRQPSEHVRGCWVVDALLGKE